MSKLIECPVCGSTAEKMLLLLHDELGKGKREANRLCQKYSLSRNAATSHAMGVGEGTENTFALLEGVLLTMLKQLRKGKNHDMS